MKAITLALLTLLLPGAAYAQAPAEVIEQAVGKSPLRFSGEATLIKWKPDHTYDVIRKGSNLLVIAVPGATTASIGLPDHGRQGGAWLMEAGTSAAHIMVPGR